MIYSNKLRERLDGCRICWHPNCLEPGRDPSMAFADLLIGRNRDVPNTQVPDVFLHTDHRNDCEEIWDFLWENGVYASNSATSVIRAAKVERVGELGRLDGYSGVLARGSGFERPNFGRAIECRVTLRLEDESTITRTVIFVSAETVEFAMEFLIPNDIRVSSIWQRGYHAGFNLSDTNGSIMRRLAPMLGVRWYFCDEERNGIVNNELVEDGIVANAFHDLVEVSPVTLTRVPLVDIVLSTCTSALTPIVQEAWITGLDGMSAWRYATTVGIQPGEIDDGKS